VATETRTNDNGINIEEDRVIGAQESVWFVDAATTKCSDNNKEEESVGETQSPSDENERNQDDKTEEECRQIH
jgi:hypothetical protein